MAKNKHGKLADLIGEKFASINEHLDKVGDVLRHTQIYSYRAREIKAPWSNFSENLFIHGREKTQSFRSGMNRASCFKFSDSGTVASLLTEQAETSSSKQTVVKVLALGIDSLGIQSLEALATHWVWL